MMLIFFSPGVMFDISEASFSYCLNEEIVSETAQTTTALLTDFSPLLWNMHNFHSQVSVIIDKAIILFSPYSNTWGRITPKNNTESEISPRFRLCVYEKRKK